MSRPTSVPPDSRPRGTRPLPEPSLLSRSWAAFLDLVRRVYDKAGEDDIFFMAGAIAFNVIVAGVPLLLTCMGIGGFLLRQRLRDPAAVLRGFILSGLPSS